MITIELINNSIFEKIDKKMFIPYSSLKFIKEIGSGAFGKVFIGEWKKTNVAIKV